MGTRKNRSGWGQGDFIPLWSAGVKPLQVQKAQDDLLHLQRGKAPLNPFKMWTRKNRSGWGQGDNIPLWGAGAKPLQITPTKKTQDDLPHLQRGKAPLNPFKMWTRKNRSGWGQGDFIPLWSAGVKPLQTTQKAQDDLLHLQRGKAPLNPFGKGYVKKTPLQDGVKGIISPCGVAGAKPLQITQKAKDDLLHLQRGKAPLNPFGKGYVKKTPLQDGVKGIISPCGLQGARRHRTTVKPLPSPTTFCYNAGVYNPP
jgi:hypothetical protein